MQAIDDISTEIASGIAPRFETQLSSRLPALSADETRLARLVCDNRFLPWLDTLQPGTGASLGCGDGGEAVLITLRCMPGEVVVSVDARAWPALALAAEDPDKQQARDVVSVLLSKVLTGLQTWLPGLVVHAVCLGHVDDRALHLKATDFELGLHAIDTPLAQHLAELLDRQPSAPADQFRLLRLPVCVGLFKRELSVDHWASLACGDVVLGPRRPPTGQPLPCRVTFGLGTTMQATAEIDLASPTVFVSEAPVPTPDDLQGSGPPLGAIGELNVPVSFEIDSARISLDGLAAIGPGSVIDLQVPAMDATIQLICLGQVVGQGQLVIVGDRLGVRIRRMGVASLERAWSRP